MTLTLEVWSDIACPWCYVGKRRLEAALKAFEERGGEAPEIRWRSFELHRDAPAEYDPSRSYVERLARKYGRSESQAQMMIDSMTATAAAEGLDFHFESIRAGSTFDAHRLLHFSVAAGLQGALKERLMAAYLEEGRLMSDHETLQELGEAVGLDAEETKVVLASDRYASEVREDQLEAARLGIRGVPFFVIAGRYGLSGAQPPEAILNVLLNASAEAKDKGTLVEGAVCEPGGVC